MNRYKKNQAEYGAKKHYSQMTEVEQEFLMRRFRAVNKMDWQFTPYSYNRMIERGITVEQLMSIFELGSYIVEYHRKDGCNRILLRSKVVIGDSNVCVVFAPDDKVIKTVFLNYKDNNHENLREEFYNSGIDVLSMYKGVKQHG